MTKPSYEELLNKQIAMCDDLAELVSTHRSDFSWQDSLEDVRNLKSELARVRGLLQRIQSQFLRSDSVGALSDIREMLKAESADIGKLDTADESGKVNSCG